MEKSPKNALQEHFQRVGLKLPKYTSVVDGEAHIPSWKSTVTLFNKMTFTGDPATRKKEADENAALKALEYIEAEGIEIPADHPTRSKSKPRLKPKAQSRRLIRRKRMAIDMPEILRHIKIYVDVENMSLILNDLCQILPLEIQIHAYLSEGRKSSLLGNLISDERTEIKITPSTRRDAADIHMILDIGKVISTTAITARESCFTIMWPHIIIVTNDHFGDALVDIIEKDLVSSICVCRSLDDVVEKIKELCSVCE